MNPFFHQKKYQDHKQFNGRKLFRPSQNKVGFMQIQEKIQQSPFNLTSDNSQIWVIWNVGSPRTGSFAYHH